MEISNGVYFFIFLFGLAVGSFLNSIIYRLETKESFLFSRSYCPHCRKLLAWPDLIPVFSFLILKRKCRYCHQKISWQYPLVEIATGTLFILTFFYFLQPLFPSILVNNTMVLLISIYYLVIGCFLIIIFVYDLKHFIIPDKIIYPAIALASLYQFFEIWNFGNWPPTFDKSGGWNLGFGILPSFFFLAIILVSAGKWMGFGDFKLAIFMGLFLSFPNILVALFLAFFLGAIIGIGLIISGKKTFKSEVPFGPLLVVGTFIALFWGEKIFNWYLNLFQYV